MLQHCSNIVPRLYLCITIGCVCIKSKEAPAKEILKDPVEMCRGVQHTIRGLLLGNYLLTQSRSMLADISSQLGSNCEGSVQFLIQSLGEMNKLWVRMQHQGAVSERYKREAERQDLRIMVCMHVVQLRQLEGGSDAMCAGIMLSNICSRLPRARNMIAQ